MFNFTEPVLCFWCDTNFKFVAGEKLSHEKAEHSRDLHERVCPIGHGVRHGAHHSGLMTQAQVAVSR